MKNVFHRDVDREGSEKFRRTASRAPPLEPRHLILNTCSHNCFQEVFLVDVAGQVYDRRELSAELRDESSAYALHVIEHETKGTAFRIRLPVRRLKIFIKTSLPT